MSNVWKWAFSVLILAVLGKLIQWGVKQTRITRLMPPGPPGVPLLGHIFLLSRLHWRQIAEWKDEYGAIFSLNLAGKRVVILNTMTTANDLLDRRSGIYSDRPTFTMAGEVLSGGTFSAFMRYGDSWRRLRRVAHRGIDLASTDYCLMQEKQSTLLLSRLLHNPGLWQAHLKQSIEYTMSSALYGWLHRDTSSDRLITSIGDIISRLAFAVAPGTYLVDIFPSMMLLPDWIAKWKRNGRRQCETDTAVLQKIFDDASDRIAAGSQERCLVTTILQDGKDACLSKHDLAWLAGILFGAGMETTTETLRWFLLSMVLHPWAMRRAQEEIDAVVGRDRIPTFQDRKNLPYIEAIVQEVLRWRPVGALGVPRCTMQDDWYKGYFIPKGTIVLFNAWAANHDPADFTNGEDFNPEQYLAASGAFDGNVIGTPETGHLTFGTGRRVCAGKLFAAQVLFINIANILWAFNIEKAKDPNGSEIEPSPVPLVEQGSVMRAAPFECVITSRGDEVAEIIEAAVRQAP